MGLKGVLLEIQYEDNINEKYRELILLKFKEWCNNKKGFFSSSKKELNKRDNCYITIK